MYIQAEKKKSTTSFKMDSLLNFDSTFDSTPSNTRGGGAVWVNGHDSFSSNHDPFGDFDPFADKLNNGVSQSVSQSGFLVTLYCVIWVQQWIKAIERDLLQLTLPIKVHGFIVYHHSIHKSCDIVFCSALGCVSYWLYIHIRL